MSIGFREIWNQRFRSVSLSRGVLAAATGLRTAGGTLASHRATSLLRSLRAITRNARWPSDPIFESFTDSPTDSVTRLKVWGLGGGLGSATDTPQGFASDGSQFCYYATMHAIRRFSITTTAASDLENFGGNGEVTFELQTGGNLFGSPKSFNDAVLGTRKLDHIGGICVFGDRVYAPIEPTNRDAVPALVELDLDLRYVRHWRLYQDDENPPEFPWVAFNPDGLMFTCRGGNTLPYGLTLNVFDPLSASPGSTLSRLGQVVLSDENGRPGAPPLASSPTGLNVGNIQGVCFSPNGHLYLAVELGECADLDWPVAIVYGSGDGPEGTSPNQVTSTPATVRVRRYGGIMGFDIFTGRRVAYEPITDWYLAGDQEIEGLAVVNLDDLNSFGGQLHAELVSNQYKFALRHWRIDPNAI